MPGDGRADTSDAFVSAASWRSSASVEVLISSSSSRCFWIVSLRADTCLSRSFFSHPRPRSPERLRQRSHFSEEMRNRDRDRDRDCPPLLHALESEKDWRRIPAVVSDGVGRLAVPGDPCARPYSRSDFRGERRQRTRGSVRDAPRVNTNLHHNPTP